MVRTYQTTTTQPKRTTRLLLLLLNSPRMRFATPLPSLCAPFFVISCLIFSSLLLQALLNEEVSAAAAAPPTAVAVVAPAPEIPESELFSNSSDYTEYLALKGIPKNERTGPQGVRFKVLASASNVYSHV